LLTLLVAVESHFRIDQRAGLELVVDTAGDSRSGHDDRDWAGEGVDIVADKAVVPRRRGKITEITLPMLHVS
jgi:hypothetical protein